MMAPEGSWRLIGQTTGRVRVRETGQLDAMGKVIERQGMTYFHGGRAAGIPKEVCKCLAIC